MGCRRGCGRKFAVGPDRAVFEVLLFPDGHGALEGVDGEAARVKGGGAVGRADGYEDAGFANFEASEAVNHGHAMDAVFFVELGADFAHFGEGHGFVGFVVEVKSGAVVGLVADETVEGDDSTVLGSADMAGQLGHVDGLADQLIDVIVGEGRHVDASATAHGREEGDFVAGTKRGIPGGEFLVARSDHRGAVFCEFGVPRRIESEKLLDRRGVGELDGILGVAGEFFEAAEKQDFHANRL
jgi:hypothetical protein